MSTASMCSLNIGDWQCIGMILQTFIKTEWNLVNAWCVWPLIHLMPIRENPIIFRKYPIHYNHIKLWDIMTHTYYNFHGGWNRRPLKIWYGRVIYPIFIFARDYLSIPRNPRWLWYSLLSKMSPMMGRFNFVSSTCSKYKDNTCIMTLNETYLKIVF